jgi:metal-responsive CopG/Arc/MetJ family transcriptional regulator
MPRLGTKKLRVEIDARLLEQFSELAKESGRSRNSLVERALRHYLRLATPAPEGGVRSLVMRHFRRSTVKNQKLLGLLGKEF